MGEIETIPYIELKHETDKAWLLVFEEDDPEDYWFPKSQCELNLDLQEITMPAWLHEEKFG